MFGIGMWELMIIFVVALLIFGPKRLPELARTLGKGMAEFRRASYDLRNSFNFDAEPPPTPPRPPETGSPDPTSLEADPGRPDQVVDSADPSVSSPETQSPSLAKTGAESPSETSNPTPPDATQDQEAKIS